jgi:hypothetical protein
MISKQPTIDDIYNFDAYLSTPGVREGLMQQAELGGDEFSVEDTDDGQATYFSTPYGEQIPVGRPVQLAAGPAPTVTDSDPYANRGYGEMTAVEPTTRQRIASFLQAGFEGMGVDRARARKQAESLIGGPNSNLPLTLGLADLVPILGTGLQLEEGVEMGKDAKKAAERGNYGEAALLGTGAALSVLPGAVPTVKALTKAGKAVAPKVGEMAETMLQKQGLMPGITEVTPKLVQERVPGVQPGEELIVQHNLTAANLVKADKLGGLPVPSLAISRAANPMDNFGEITLIAPKEFANPSAKNPVFGADAYTARFPTIDFQIDAKSEKKLQAFMGDVIDILPEGQRKFGSAMQDWKNRKYSDLFKGKFLSERGELPDPKDFENTFVYQQALNRRIDGLQSEYADWIEALDGRLEQAGVNVNERIFKGFTYSGNRRYAAATLDNIVKEMKGGAGDEGFNYGVGNLRAVATPKFRTLSQIKAARGKLVDGKKMDEIKQQAQDAYVSVLERMREVNDRYSAEDALLEFAESKRISTLDKIYDGKMPDELKADIGIFLQKIQQLPTEYFELKPQRAVSLEEFKGAIIPATTPQSARDVLNKAGVTDIYEYSTPEERKSLFQKYGKEMFTAAPGGTALGAATMSDEENE